MSALVVVLTAGCTGGSSEADGPLASSDQIAIQNPASPAPVPERTGTIPFPSPGDVYGPITSPQPPNTEGSPAPQDGRTGIPSPPAPPPLPPPGDGSSTGGMPQAQECQVVVRPGSSASSIVVDIEHVGQPTAVWMVVTSRIGTQSGPVDVVPGMNQREIPQVEAASAKVDVFALPAGPTGVPVCTSS